jgi:CheY-like chemotaxis protein
MYVPSRIEYSPRPNVQAVYLLAGLEEIQFMPTARVLCVEDDADTRELLKMLLGYSDFEAVVAPDADAALRLMRGERFSLYVLDGGLRGARGLSLCEQIRASDARTPSSFSRVTLPPLTSNRAFHTTVYDAANNRMTLFGGGTGQFCSGAPPLKNDVWALTNADGSGGTPNWTQLSPAGSIPSVRTSPLLALLPS